MKNMNKKEYSRPNIKVVEITSTQLICQSRINMFKSDSIPYGESIIQM